jgi:hypothetical protein
MAITFTICPANGPPEWIGTALPENAGYEAVRSVVEGRLGGPMAHLRCGEGTRQLSVLVNEAAELAGEPLNIMATAILRAYLGGRAAPGSRTCPTEIHGVAIIPDHALMF